MKLFIIFNILAIVLFGSFQTSFAKPNEKNLKKVIIVGAGISGLSAANTLLEKGFNNFLILEAHNRIGGRINTIKYNESFLELGAQYVSIFDKSPIYDLAVKLGQFENASFSEIFMTYSNNKKMVPDETKEEVNEIFQELLNKTSTEIQAYRSQKILNGSLGLIVKKNFNLILQKLKKENYKSLDLLQSYYNQYWNLIKSLYPYSTLDELGINEKLEYVEHFTTNYGLLKKGFKGLIDHLASKLENKTIKLNRQVQNIDWSDKNKNGIVKLKVLDRINNKTETYEANAVLVTASLGVLKANHKALFRPNLPADKVNSLNKIEFGTVNKVFAIFDKPITPFIQDKMGISFLWPNNQTIKMFNSLTKSNSSCGFQHGNKFYKSFDYFIRLNNHDNILLQFVSGNDAKFIENYSEECLLKLLNMIFENFIPNKDFPKVTKIVKSEWFSDPFQRGSYSFLKVGGTISDIANYAKPMNKKVYFSGDSTITDYEKIGYTHGAMTTGQNTAAEIYKNL